MLYSNQTISNKQIITQSAYFFYLRDYLSYNAKQEKNLNSVFNEMQPVKSNKKMFYANISQYWLKKIACEKFRA